MENSSDSNADKSKSLRVGLLICLFASVFSYLANYLWHGQVEVGTGLLTLVGILTSAMLALQVTRVPVEETRKAGEKIRQAESRLEEHPEKSRFAWDLARATLEAYFNRNLSQITWIFWLSLAVMVAGFGIIIYGISQTVGLAHEIALKTNPEKSSLETIKNLPAIISTVAGLVTEFIGATFLFIYRSTIQQATNYSKTLERINSIGMAMQIFDTMPDTTQDTDLKSHTKARTVELLVRGAYEQRAQPEKTSTFKIKSPKTGKPDAGEK
jgi:TRADD-N domain-containing protein